MSENSWTDRIAGERMSADRKFADQVQSSAFSNQQWGLIMTAVEFEIENPGTPEEARIVADTSKLSSIMPELDKFDQQGPMGGPSGSSSGSGGGLLSGVASALGFGGGGNNKREEEAADLAQAYAEELQKQLESKGRWESICKLAQ